MRKSLIATLVLGAIATPAFAAGTVTLYGQVNVTGVYSDNGSHDRIGGVDQRVKQFKIDQGNTPSRIGFKGDEDLGGGLQAWWQLETAVGTDDAATNNFANREGWVGLQGGFGKIGLGRGTTPYADVANVFDSTVDGANNLAIYRFEQHNEKAFGRIINNRFSNAVRYDSPTAHGFSGSVMVGNDENKAPGNKGGSKISLAGRYEAGPMYFAAAFNKEKNLPVMQGRDSIAAPGRDSTAVLLAGVYTIDAFKFGLGFQHAKLQYMAQGDIVKRNSIVTTAAYTMGDTTLKAGVIVGQNPKLNGATVKDASFTRFSIGAKHQLSKRTVVFAELSGDRLKGRVLSDDNISRRVSPAPMPAADIVADDGTVKAPSPRFLSIGLMHAF
ncbi:porin [Chitinimonas arctica]|uniref:Porin n=1 Tax=Chitinimonas arctica TaxID=2594795 RepID=A0A516SB06_9NEIS|nr:porin [Chitinimonas arctica]QDQ25326.1 porin [Chitinimonas arctica]